MNRSVSYLVFLSCLMVLTPLYAGTQTLTTYYPAPQGNYKNMTINDILTIPSSAGCSPTGTNTVLISNLTGTLEVCDKTNVYDLTSNTLWTSPSPFHYMYPTNTAENVGIGAWGSDPGATLGVKGGGAVNETDLTVTGRIRTGDGTNSGGVWVNSAGSLFMGQDTANNIGFYNNVSGSGGWDLIVSSSGNTGIGLNDNPTHATLDVAGTLSVYPNSSSYGGYMLVAGNTTINTSVQGLYLDWNLSGGTGETDFINDNGGAPGGFQFLNTPPAGPRTQMMYLQGNGTLQVNASQAGSGNLSGNTIPKFWICNNAGANCGWMAVAQSASDNNWYAVYGP